MREIVMVVLVGALFGVGSLHLFPSAREKDDVSVKKECFFDEVKFLEPVNCSRLSENKQTVPHGSNCTFIQHDENLPTVERLICNNGHWSGTDFSVGDHKTRHKRFLDILLLGAILGAATCVLFCDSQNQNTAERPRHSSSPKPQPRSRTYYPPKFSNPCKPREIMNTYTVAPGSNSIKVSWTEPRASSRNGRTPRVHQVSGGTNGGMFRGAVGGKTHYITYKATDDQGLTGYCHFVFTVTETTCTTPQWPSNGQRNCDDFRVGSKCRYECHVGYKLVGNSVVTCENTQTWSSIPTCEKMACRPPTPPVNGNVDCTDLTYSYQSVCAMRCDEGYSLQGQLYTQCQKDGTWLNNANSSCIDDSPPSLACKTPQIFYADRGSSSTSVTWAWPTVTDSTDPAPEILKKSGPSMGEEISAGTTHVTYIAIDYDGNKSPECRIELRVQEITCGHPLDTLQNKFLVFNCSGTKYTYGVECKLSCLAHFPLNGTDLITCEKNGASLGVWDWGDGTKPFCEELSCPKLDPPINGALVEKTRDMKPIYIMSCNDKYDIPNMGSNFNGMLTCIDSNEWFPTNYVPNCVETQIPYIMRLPGEAFYYGGDCGTPETMEKIRLNYIKTIQTTINPLFSQICSAHETCTAENPVIRCGPIHHKRKRRTIHVQNDAVMRQSRIPIHSVVEFRRRIQKRQVEKRLLVVEFDITVKLKLSEGQTLESKLPVYDDIISNLSAAIPDLLKNGSLDIPNFTTKSDSWKTRSQSLECRPGFFKLRGTHCQPCPSGHYLNETTNKCYQCPIGQYAEREGSIDCLLCDVGYSTKQIGSKFLDNCTELCGPGTSSPDGMQPCSSCLYGEYQDDVGQTTCKQCPSGTTTQTTNTTSSQDCQSYDILLEETSGPVSVIRIPSNIHDMTMLFWTKPVDTSHTMCPDFNFRCVRNERPRTQRPQKHSFYHKQHPELRRGRWTHITYVLAVNKLYTYINGVLKSTAGISRTPNCQPMLTVWSDPGGAYLTGFRLLNRTLTTSEIAAHASSCHMTEIDDVVNMDIFQKPDVNGISLISSSSCDAIDNCEPDPCNGHQCTDGQDTFVCHCNSGWSGDTCSVPPDYCINNECTNGATCQNGVSNYTCDCLPGYSGTMCETPPVNGGWSDWDSWSECTQRCGNGSQTRKRSCDSPVPDMYGSDCAGKDEGTTPCNTDACQVCEDLPRKYGTLVNCSTDLTTGSRACVMYCEKDKIMPPGLRDSQEYKCGPNTDYEWESGEQLPYCIVPTSPTTLEVTSNIEYNTDVQEGDIPSLTESILDNVKSTPCSDTCTPSIHISKVGNITNGKASRIMVTLKFSINLKLGPELHIERYVKNGTVSGPLQELADSLSNLELTAQVLQNNTASIFDVTINGKDYAANTSSLVSEGIVSCPVGLVAIDGLCLECPPGTYSDGNKCTSCARGTYQPSSGESSCIKCPSLFTTATIRATDLSNCSETLTTTTSVSTHTDEPNKTLTTKTLEPTHTTDEPNYDCSAGTFSNGHDCIPCAKDTYQPSSGKSACIKCPTTLTTVTTGSIDLSNCSETLTTSISSHPPTSNISLNLTVMIPIMVLVIVCLAIALIWYKCRDAPDMERSTLDIPSEIAEGKTCSDEYIHPRWYSDGGYVDMDRTILPQDERDQEDDTYYSVIDDDKDTKL